MRKIGLLGGSFNPAHAGHVHISLEALKRLKLDEVWWLVSPQNPLKSKSDMASYEVRLQFARQLMRHPRIRVLDIEAKRGLYYSIDTLRYVQSRYRNTQFIWLMGADNLANFHLWRNWRDIAARVPIAVLDRAPYGLRALHQRFATRYRAARIAHLTELGSAPGWTYMCIPRHPLSSTYLRKLLGKSAFLRHSRENH